MSTRPHIVVLHRWGARYAEYERYLDHAANAVTYLSTAVGVVAIPEGAAEVVVVPATDDLAAVSVELARLAQRFGPPSGIVGLKEDDLIVAAQLRADWNCPGPRQAELLPFRDKLVMAEAVGKAGVPVPEFAAAHDAETVRDFGDEHGWPLIVKPRVGSSSQGVSKLDSPADCEGLDFASEGPMLVQAFDSRQIYQVDGYFQPSGLGPHRVARYVNTCLGFRSGEMLGSVEEDEPQLVKTIGEFAFASLSALTDKPTVFHLEVFCDPLDGSCAFLEVGARVSGAEIPFLWREVYGLDLMEIGLQLALGRTPSPEPVPPAADPIAGYLLAPAPAERPCRISSVTPMLGQVPGLYAEELLKPGDVLPAADSYYEHVGGRFRFRGATTAEVEAAIRSTADNFTVDAQPL